MNRNEIVGNQDTRSPTEFGAPEEFGPAEVSYNENDEVLRIYYPVVNETETRQYIDGKIRREFFVGSVMTDQVEDYE